MINLPVLPDDLPSDPWKSPEDQLRDLLETFGRDKTLPIPVRGPSDPMVDVGALIQQIPATWRDSGVNPARDVLNQFYYAIDPKLRRKGAFITCETLVGLLLERLEFFEQLSRNLARVCRGKTCPHFKVCRFREQTADVAEEDGILCAVERELIRHTVEVWVRPPDGSKGVIDPRRTEMAFLFQQLVQLLVLQLRYSMYMQVHDVLAPQFDKIRQADGSELPVHLNNIEHPLLSGWQKTTQAIQKVVHQMGRSPEFLIRQGKWQDDEQTADAETRAREMLTETYENMLAEHEEGSVEYQLISAALDELRRGVDE